MLVTYSSLLAVVRARLLVTVDWFCVGRKDIGRRVVVHLCEGWRVDYILIGHESHILVDIDIDGRRCAVSAVGVSTISTHISILLEVSNRFLCSFHLSNQLIGMHLSLSFLRILSLVQTIDLRNNLLILDLALIVDLDLEELHPTDSSYRILRQHPNYQILQKGRNGPRELQFFAIEYLDKISDGVRLKGAHSKNHLKQDYPKRPYIRLIRVYLSFEHLRRHINGRPKHGLSHFIRRVQILTEPKIPQLDDPVMKENIIRFHIPMHNIVLIQYLKRILKLLKDQQSILLR